MHRSRALWVALVALAFLSPAQAGSATNPEITDPAGDQSNSQAGFTGADLVADAFLFTMQATGATSSGPANGLSYRFHATYQGAEIVGEAAVSGTTVTPQGAASAATRDGNTVTVTVPKSAFGTPRPGTNLTSLYADARATLATAGSVVSEDRAPDAEFGRPYVIGSEADAGVDFDGDGVDDRDELADGTDPTSPDTDGDGLNDGDERRLGTDPNKVDSDGDGLSDGDEVARGTDPTKADTDGDGLSDGDEVARGTDPTKADTDGDGLSDGAELAAGTDPTKADSDADGLSDGEEVALGTNPLSPDSDGDGISDGAEVAAGKDPLDGSDGSDTLGDLPLHLPNWLWYVIFVLAALLVALLVTYVVALILTRRRGEAEDADGEDGEEGDVDDLGRRRPFRVDEDYLKQGLTPEQIAAAKRRFDERERRYVEYAHPERAAMLDVEPASMATDEADAESEGPEGKQDKRRGRRGRKANRTGNDE
jgi:hypothetical protein